jgi:hypothetical protein
MHDYVKKTLDILKAVTEGGNMILVVNSGVTVAFNEHF